MTTMSSYLELFRESEANQVRLLGKKGLQDLRRDHSIRHAVITIWQISFMQIQRSEQPAADLLALMSMFDRQGIPASLLRNSTSQLDFEDALAPLLNFSLVRAEMGEQSFGMHRLVQLSMRTWLEGEKQFSRWAKQSIGVLAVVFPSGDYETWEDCQVLLPHAREVFSHVAGDEEDVLKQAEIGLRIEWYLLLTGEYKAAEKVGRMCVEAREKALGSEYPDTLTSVSQLGSVSEWQGKCEEAEAMHQQALKAREKVLGPEHPDTLTSMDNLASPFWHQRLLHEAEDLEVRVMELSRRVLGDKHPNTLTAMHNLACTLKSQRRNKEAISLMETCFQLRKQILDDRHPSTESALETLTVWQLENME
jgi:tetratricopeptide (TPR) repeat protein